MAELHDLDALEVIRKIRCHPWLHSHDIGTMLKKRANFEMRLLNRALRNALEVPGSVFPKLR